MSDLLASWLGPDLFGQLIKVLLPSGAIVAAYAWWKRRWPLKLRMRDADGRPHRRIRLPTGSHRIRLVLSTRVPRQAKSYQLELLETDWHSLWLAHRLPHQARIVSMSNVALQQTHGGQYLASGSGTNLQVWGPAPVPCGADVMAFVDVNVTAIAPWNGGLRIEAMSPSETTKRVAIPIAFV